MGHIQTRERGGKKRYVVRYTGPDGKERTKTFDKLGKPDVPGTAKHFLSDTEGKIRQGDWVDPEAGKITLAQLWSNWESTSPSAGTERIRKRVGKNLGQLERMYISSIRPAHLREWIHALRTGRPWVEGCTGIAETTINTWSGQLCGCLNLAASDKLIRESPFNATVRKNRRDTRSVTPGEIPSTADVFAIADAARAGKKGGRNWVPPNRTFARMVIVGASTGLRAGEIAGLRISAVDFLRREMEVKEQSTSRTSEFEWGPLKTEASERVLPLPQVAIDAIAEELAENPSDDRSLPVFRTSRGRMFTSSTVAYSFRSARNRCGFAGFTWHSLRHFYASTLIYSGSSVKTVQIRMGHASPTETLNTYTHLWPGEGDRTRSALDAVLKRDEGGTDPDLPAEEPGGKVLQIG
ncbi:putative integrase [uncultured Caudovirales phage]|uniref:Integrase n=1 Tax=uncultured Caudovirales phage TaxID=2100421 RepID=A0A2H4J790_9CAUD|nr:putative integrase [uncultured Caudovirales phage]